MHRWIFALALCGGFFYGLAHPLAHDGYMHVYEHNAKPGDGKQLCCGGDPETGDCEALTWEQVETLPDGVRFTSKRYGGVVFVPSHRVEWTIPLNAMNGNPAFPNDPFAAHWCGKPRAAMAGGYGSGAPTSDDQVDPVFWTFCAFVKAGGV